MANSTTSTGRRCLGAMVVRDIAPEEVVGHASSLAEALDELWVVEDLPFAGGISQMTAILAATSDVVVGHGIAPAPFRTAAALAMEWATLERMYPGRIGCGLGHGLQSWMGQLGERVGSPLTLIRETCDGVRSLLAGEHVDSTGRYVTIKDVELVFPPATVPAVSLGVTGPKSLELAGEVADGTILSESHGPTEIAAAMERIEHGRSVGSRTDFHRITVFASFHVGDVSEIVRNPDAPVGWEAVSPNADSVAAELASLYEAGAHSVVLVPLSNDPIASLESAKTVLIPKVRTLVAGLSNE